MAVRTNPWDFPGISWPQGMRWILRPGNPGDFMHVKKEYEKKFWPGTVSSGSLLAEFFDRKDS